MINRWTPVGTATDDRELLRQAYRRGDRHGEVTVGERWIFWGAGLQIRYLPLEELVWAYLRQEDSRVTVCCGKGTLPSYFLILVHQGGERCRIPMEQKATAEGVLDVLPGKHPRVEIGYYPELEERFSALGGKRT